jgi:hypothetical protein
MSDEVREDGRDWGPRWLLRLSEHMCRIRGFGPSEAVSSRFRIVPCFSLFDSIKPRSIAIRRSNLSMHE